VSPANPEGKEAPAVAAESAALPAWLTRWL